MIGVQFVFRIIPNLLLNKSNSISFLSFIFSLPNRRLPSLFSEINSNPKPYSPLLQSYKENPSLPSSPSRHKPNPMLPSPPCLSVLCKKTQQHTPKSIFNTPITTPSSLPISLFPCCSQIHSSMRSTTPPPTRLPPCWP